MAKPVTKGPPLIPPAVVKKLEGECRKVAIKVGKGLGDGLVGRKAESAIEKGVCKQIKTIDKKVVKLLADELKKQVDKANEQDPKTAGPPPKPTANFTPRKPGAGVPSVTIPIYEWVVRPEHDTKAKISIRVWADPRDLEKDKGVMVNFEVVRF